MTRENTVRASMRVMMMAASFGAMHVAMAQAPRPHGPSAPAVPMVVAPPAERCQLMVSEARVDYGTTTRYRLESNGTDMSLGKRRMTMNVTCSSASTLGIVFRAPSLGTDYIFGNVGGKSGKVTLQMSEAQIDGVPAQLGNAMSAGTLPAAIGGTARFTPGQAIVPVIDGRPAQGTRFSATVDIDPVVPRGDNQVSSPTPLESNGAFQVLWR